METSNPYQAPVHGSQLIASPRLGVKQVLFSFTGRIPRRTFWLWYLITVVAFMIFLGLITAVFSTLSAETGDESVSTFGGILMIVSFIPTLWIIFALLAKRWHDRDKSGAWILFYFIPLVGPIWTFVECGCLRGTHGHNSYGGDPT